VGGRRVPVGDIIKKDQYRSKVQGIKLLTWDTYLYTYLDTYLDGNLIHLFTSLLSGDKKIINKSIRDLCQCTSDPILGQDLFTNLTQPEPSLMFYFLIKYLKFPAFSIFLSLAR